MADRVPKASSGKLLAFFASLAVPPFLGLGGSMKGDDKNKLLPQRRQEMFLEIQPPLDIRGKALLPGRDRIGIDPDWEIAIRSISISASSAASLNASCGVKPSGVVLATRVLSETRGLQLYGVIRGHIV